MFQVDPNMRRSHGDSIISMLDRSSIMDIKKKKNYQNTYKLEPDEKTPMAEAKQIINDVIKGFLAWHFEVDINRIQSGTCEGMDYEIASQNSTMISSLTNEIQKRLKSLCEKRYRIIAQVFFIENNDQDVHVASKVTFGSISHKMTLDIPKVAVESILRRSYHRTIRKLNIGGGCSRTLCLSWINHVSISLL